MASPVEMQSGERISAVFRRHWMYAYPKVVGLVLIAILGPVILLWIINMTSGLGGTAGKIAFAVSALWLIYWLFWRAYFTWYRYQHDLWIITNQRLIDVLKTNWVHQTIASADLANVQDIGVVRSGVLATTFNYGDVQCETAGQISRFTLSGIPKPTEVLSMIDAARDAARREATQRGTTDDRPRF